MDTQKITPDFDAHPPPPPPTTTKQIAEALSPGTRAIVCTQWQRSFNKLLHCRRMHKFLYVACLALAMQHLLKSCRNNKNSYNNILSANFPIAPCTGVAVLQTFPRYGNAITVLKITLQSQVKICSCSRSLRNLKKIAPVSDIPAKKDLPRFQT